MNFFDGYERMKKEEAEAMVQLQTEEAKKAQTVEQTKKFETEKEEAEAEKAEAEKEEAEKEEAEEE